MILQFDRVSFHYGSLAPIFDGVSFRLDSNGDCICLVGPSGTGKSTVLKLALGLLEPTSGTITKRAIHPLPIMQNFGSSMLPWFDLQRNIWFGSTSYDETRLHRIADILELTPILRSRPFEVSGGQLQRAIFARALYHEPDLLLVDEPFSSLDIPTSRRLLPGLAEYMKRLRTSILWITHRSLEPQLLAARVLLLDNGTTIEQAAPSLPA